MENAALAVEGGSMLYGHLHVTVKNIRGVRIGHAQPAAVAFRFGNENKTVPLQAQGLTVTLSAQTLTFTCWTHLSDHVKVSALTENGQSVLGGAAIMVRNALKRATRKTPTVWHNIVDHSGHDVAEVMVFMRWVPVEATPETKIVEPAVVALVSDKISWMPLTGVCKTVEACYRRVRTIPPVMPFARVAECVVGSGYVLLAHRDVSGVQGAFCTAADAVSKAGKGCFDWTVGTVDYFKVGTASNFFFLVDVATSPIRGVMGMMMKEDKHPRLRKGTTM